MNWLNTERVSTCIEAVLYAVRWIHNACSGDNKVDETIKELLEKEKKLMMELRDLSSSIKPSTPESTEEFDFSQEERCEPVEDDKKFTQVSKELKALCKKRSSLLKKKERKEAFLQFYSGCLTNLSQFTYFILRHLSDIFVCIILVLMTNASMLPFHGFIGSGYEQCRRNSQSCSVGIALTEIGFVNQDHVCSTCLDFDSILLDRMSSSSSLSSLIICRRLDSARCKLCIFLVSLFPREAHPFRLPV